jgi:Protein of unknown function (DUF3048) N-terminal domain/Protein of unknown function (DUF3048) C-terminal domain
MPRTHRRRSSMTHRGKVIAASVTVVLVIGGALGYFTLFPQQAPAFVRNTLGAVGLAESAPPVPTCPLTGEPAAGGIPAHPALAIKVENAPEARPQSGLNDADVVVEEPVEGGYTRFIAIFQCAGSDRVGPVRSGRTTDPNFLRQLGTVVFGYAGGVPSVQRDVSRAGLVDVNYIVAASAYTRDDARPEPHNLYTTTAALWKAARQASGAPDPLFTYDDTMVGRSRRVGTAHIPYSSVSDVYWTWSRPENAWLRAHGTVPHTLEDGSRVSATNVVVEIVDVSDSSILDAAGNPSPEVNQVGSGRAFILRGGRLIAARWERRSLEDTTTYTTRDGDAVSLAPGRTWVELVPSSITPTFER